MMNGLLPPWASAPQSGHELMSPAMTGLVSDCPQAGALLTMTLPHSGLACTMMTAISCPRGACPRPPLPGALEASAQPSQMVLALSPMSSCSHPLLLLASHLVQCSGAAGEAHSSRSRRMTTLSAAHSRRS